MNGPRPASRRCKPRCEPIHRRTSRMIELNISVGATIERAREAAGLSKNELGALAGAKGEFLGRIERGDAPCPLHVLVGIADALDTTLDALVPVNIDGEEIGG